MTEVKKELSQVTLTVGPKGRLIKGGISFTGNAASLATGGRLTNWLPQIIIAAKRARTQKLLKRKYGVEPAAEKKTPEVKKPEVKAPVVPAKK